MTIGRLRFKLSPLEGGKNLTLCFTQIHWASRDAAPEDFPGAAVR